MHTVRSLIAAAAGVLISISIAGSSAEAAGIAWQQNLQEAARQSVTQHKPLLVMVKASWCGPCHQMLAQTFPDPAVTERVNQQFVPVLIDADAQAATAQSLRVEAMPTVLLISPEQKLTSRIVGFQSAAQFRSRLEQFAPAAVRQVNRQTIRPAPPSLSSKRSPPKAVSSFLERHAVKVPSRDGFAQQP